MAAPAFAADTGYRITRHLKLDKATHLDYAAIDEVRQRLFVTLGDHVDVVEISSGKMMATISNTQGAHGVAFAQDLKLGFISNGHSSSVTVFDLDTLKPKEEISVPGKNPDAILYEESVHKLYAFNGDSEDENKNVEVIDATTLKVIDTIKATGAPEFAVSDAKGRIYFNIEKNNPGINVIDVASDKVVNNWPLEGCEGPTGLAIDRQNMRLFSACKNGIVAVTDARTGKRVTQFHIGEHPDAVIYDPETRTVLTSGGGGNGTLTIAYQDDADHYTVRQSVVTEKGARTMAMEDKSKTIYLPTVIKNKAVIVVATHKD